MVHTTPSNDGAAVTWFEGLAVVMAEVGLPQFQSLPLTFTLTSETSILPESSAESALRYMELILYNIAVNGY